MRTQNYAAITRWSAGIVFVAAGLLKLLVARKEFDAMLVMTRAPLPHFFAIAVPLLEVVGGVALCANRRPRIWAGLLSLDMLAAIYLVGEPGVRGRTRTVGSHTVGGEVWRLPLEIALLFGMLWLALRREEK